MREKGTALAFKVIWTKAGIACQVRTISKQQRGKEEGLQEEWGTQGLYVSLYDFFGLMGKIFINLFIVLFSISLLALK